jgi:integrase
MPILFHKHIEALQPKDKIYFLSDVENLAVKVMTSGSKFWVFRYSFQGKQQAPITLGRFPLFKAAEARDKCNEYKKLVDQGIDPKEFRELEKGMPTFADMFKRWHATKKTAWTANTFDKSFSRMQAHVLPIIGKNPVDEIDTLVIFNLLEGFTSKAHDGFSMMETRDYCKSYIKRTLDYCVVKKLIKFNPYYAIDHKELPATKHTNFATTTDDKGIADILSKLNSNMRGSWQITYSVKLAAHLMLRPNEIAGLKWREIYFKDKRIVIEDHRMKKRREHDVPMSSQVLEIFNYLKELSGDGEYVFPSVNVRNKNGHIGSDSMRKRLRVSGITKDQLTTHGWRAMAATCLTGGLNEEDGYDLHIVKKQLSHLIGSKTDQAYMRSAYYQKRKAMMQAWSDKVDSLSISDSLI